MPKITGQAVPAELLALYTALTSPAKVTQGADGVLKLRKNKRKPKRRTPENLDLIALQKTAHRVALLLGYPEGSQPYKDFLFTLTRDLLLGIFNPDYFRPCVIRHAMTFVSTVESIVDPTPPPYSYRVTDNRPTIPTYSSGLPTSLPPGYEGFTVGVDYKDSYLRWRKISFLSPYINEPYAQETVLIRWNCKINISASKRGSRPMLSLNLKMQTCREFDSALDTYEPPIIKKTSLYWRFKMPPSDAPYFNTYQVRSIVKGGSRMHQNSGTGDRVAYLLNASNRPMMGRGFNNNQAVQTSFEGDPEMWEIKPCLGELSRPIQKSYTTILGFYSAFTGAFLPSSAYPRDVVVMVSEDIALLKNEITNRFYLADFQLNRTAEVLPTPDDLSIYGLARIYGNFHFWLRPNGVLPGTFHRIEDDGTVTDVSSMPYYWLQAIRVNYPLGGVTSANKYITFDAGFATVNLLGNRGHADLSFRYLYAPLPVPGTSRIRRIWTNEKKIFLVTNEPFRLFICDWPTITVWPEPPDIGPLYEIIEATDTGIGFNIQPRGCAVREGVMIFPQDAAPFLLRNDGTVQNLPPQTDPGFVQEWAFCTGI